MDTRVGATDLLDADLVDQWEELARRTGASPFLRPAWVRARHRAFTPRAPVEVLTVRRAGELAGILPLFRRRRTLVSFDGYDTEAGPVALDVDVARELGERLVASRSSVDLRSVPAEDGWADVVAEAAARRGAPCTVATHRSSLQVDVDRTFADYEASLGRNRRQQARRRWRRLGERGAVDFEVRDGTEALDRLLAEGFAVEASGWKGASGTAITSSPAQHRFYTEFARSSAERGSLRLYFLRVDGVPIAFSYDLRGPSAQYHLKGGFDETWGDLSPGILLRMRIIEDICGDPSVARYDLLGRPDSWKAQLADEGRERVRVRLHPSGVIGATRHAGRLAAARARSEAEARLPDDAWRRVHRTVRRVRRPV